jgi:hypothetical protein
MTFPDDHGDYDPDVKRVSADGDPVAAWLIYWENAAGSGGLDTEYVVNTVKAKSKTFVLPAAVG